MDGASPAKKVPKEYNVNAINKTGFRPILSLNLAKGNIMSNFPAEKNVKVNPNIEESP